VKLEELGFERERILTVQAGRIHEFEIRGRKGYLRVQVQPWARVSIDGHEVGITPLAPLPLLEGTHKVELDNPDLGRGSSEVVRIEANQTKELKRNLNDASKL
jgi:hypothetical protein